MYKSLAHPELNGYVQPFTLEERLRHIQEAGEKLQTQIEWLCDSMGNELKHALGNAQNSEFVVDPQGIVVSRRAWSDPRALRKFLEETVGPVENPAPPAELARSILLAERGKIPTGVVPRLSLPPGLVPLRIHPFVDGEVPFYVKLRAEAQRSLLEQGRGKLYLGFHLDPLYKVHWNNLSPPLEFTVEAPGAVRVTPEEGRGPRVEEPADKDPREFLLEVSAQRREPLEVAVRYFACDDADTFCVPVSQRYRVFLERDPDGGQARRGSPPARGREFRERLRGMDRDGDGRLSADEVPAGVRNRFSSLDENGDGFLQPEELQEMARRRAGPDPETWVRRLLERDADGDGKIGREEVPPPLLRRFDQMDRNHDGLLDEEELREAATRFRRGPGR